MKRNRLLVGGFLLGVVGFTALMTFYVGPRMMAVREEVARDQHFYKCQRVISGGEIEVQLRGWERPNRNPEFPVRLAGVEVPPLTSAEDPVLIDWAETRGVDPAQAAEMAEAAHRTLLAFIRKQNLVLETTDGRRAGQELQPGTPVHVFVSGTQVNRKLLQSGLARLAPDTAAPYLDRYTQAEKEAQSAERGLWK